MVERRGPPLKAWLTLGAHAQRSEDYVCVRVRKRKRATDLRGSLPATSELREPEK